MRQQKVQPVQFKHLSLTQPIQNIHWVAETEQAEVSPPPALFSLDLDLNPLSVFERESHHLQPVNLSLVQYRGKAEPKGWCCDTG